MRFMPSTCALAAVLMFSWEASSQNPSSPEVPTHVADRISAFMSSDPSQGDGLSAGGAHPAIVPDEFTGSLSASVAISVPAHRGSLLPSLDLVYRSGGENTWLGVGWDCDLGSIGRNTKDGISWSADNYVFRAGGSSSELVKRNGFYWARTEESFSRYAMQPATAGNAPYWVATDRFGRKYRFGFTATSRIHDPVLPGRILRWHVDRVEDVNGNHIEIDYTSVAGVNYPAVIRLGCHGAEGCTGEVIFHLEARAAIDQPVSYAATFPVTLTRRLKTIETRGGGTLFSAYDLQYESSAETGRARLAAVTAYGRDATIVGGAITGGKSFPPARFEYTKVLPAESESIRFDSESASIDLVDVDNDGRADACRTVGAENHASAQVACALSAGLEFKRERRSAVPGFDWGYPDSRAWVDFDGDGLKDFCRVVGESYRFFARCTLATPTGFGAQITSPELRDPYLYGRAWVDIDDDGKCDFCSIVRDSTMPLTEITREYLIDYVPQQAMGTGYVSCLRSSGTAFMAPIRTPHINLGQRSGWGWGDVDGDRRLEYCRILADETMHPPPILGVGCASPFLNRDIKLHTGSFAEGAPYGRSWVDVNGDGLTDYCRVVGGDIKCSIVQPRSFFPPLQFLGPGRASFATEWSATVDVGAREGRTWQDVNGDGVAEYCRVIKSTSQPLCTGIGSAGESVKIAWWPSATGDMIWERQWADVTGDGIAEYCGVVSYGGTSQLRCAPAIAEGLDLLAGVRNGMGGLVSIQYKPSSEYDNRYLPFSVPTVAGITHDDGRGQASHTVYEYFGGAWNRKAKEFRGFARVRKVGPESNGERTVIETFFHQGNSTSSTPDDPNDLEGITKGKPFLVHTLNDARERLLERRIEYHGDTDGAAPYFTPAASVTQETCRGATCGTRSVTTYEHDGYGNVTRQNEYGRSSDGVTTERTIVRRFIPNDVEWIVSLAATEKIYVRIPPLSAPTTPCPQGADPDLESCIDFYYDGNATCTTPASSQQPQVGHLTRTVVWNGDGTPSETRTEFGRYGEVICRANAAGQMTNYTYDPTGNFVLRARTPRGFVTETSYYGVNGAVADRGAYGQLRSVTDPNGAVSTRIYDTLGRLTRETARDGSLTDYDYVALGDPAAQRIETRTQSLTSRAYFDGLGRVYTSVRSGPAQKWIRTEKRFDGRGFVSAESTPYFDGTARPAWTLYERDAVGRITKVVGVNGHATTNCYEDWITTTIDPLGRRVRTLRDANGRVTRIDEYLGQHTSCSTREDRPYATTRYAYDAMGRVASITDTLGEQTRYSYDLQGRRTKAETVNSGTWTYEYDPMGDLLVQRGPGGRTTTLQYDEEHRVVSRITSYGGRTETTKYTYDRTDVPNGLTRLSSIQTSDGTAEGYVYDAEGRLVSIERIIGGKSYVSRHKYDQDGRPVSTMTPDGASLTYTYDGPFPKDVRSGMRLIAAVDEFDASGRELILRYGNGVITASSWCAEGNFNLCSSRTVHQSEVLSDTQYRYDAAGTLSFIVDPRSGNQTFSYDDIGRLSYALGWYGETALRWDEVGNIAFQSGLGSYHYDYQSQAPYALRQAGKMHWSYDDAGNEVRGPDRKLTYDAAGRVSTVEHDGAVVGSTYLDGGRVRRTVSRYALWPFSSLLRTLTGKRSVVEDHRVVSPEFRCVNDHCARWLVLGGRPVAIEDTKKTAIHYLHHDYRGSLFLVTGNNGAPFRWSSYAPFGAMRRSGGQHRLIPEVFAGYELDDEADLFFASSRYYDYKIGRFIATDRGTPSVGDPQLLNAYAYARGNPLAYVDPDGENPFLIAILVGAVFGGLQAGMASDWDVDAVLRGAVVGAIASGVGAGVGAVAGPVFGGAAGSAAGALMNGGDVGQAVVLGVITVGLGAGLSEAVGPQLGMPLAAAGTAAMMGEDPAQAAVYAFASQAASDYLSAQSDVAPDVTTVDIAESRVEAAPHDGPTVVPRGGGVSSIFDRSPTAQAIYAEIVYREKLMQLIAYDKPVYPAFLQADMVIPAARLLSGFKYMKNARGFEKAWTKNFRTGWHRLPPGKYPGAGRNLPHYHRRPGIGKHRPWQGGF